MIDTDLLQAARGKLLLLLNSEALRVSILPTLEPVPGKLFRQLQHHCSVGGMVTTNSDHARTVNLGIARRPRLES